MDKLKGYCGAFVVGGVLGTVAFLIFNCYLMAGIQVVMAITFMVYTMALIGGVLTIMGVYQKVTKFGGMGAMMPMCGLSGGMAEYMIALRKDGLPSEKVLKMGLTAPLKIFAVCYGTALILAIVAKFVNLEVVPPADSMDAVGFAPLITGFQAIGMFNAFLVSGVFCLVGQVIFVNTKLDFVKIFMGCVVLGVILSATGVMSYITNFGSGGMFLSVIDAGEAAYLALKGLVLEGDLFNICRYTILVLGILVTGVACGFIAKKTAND